MVDTQTGRFPTLAEPFYSIKHTVYRQQLASPRLAPIFALKPHTHSARLRSISDDTHPGLCCIMPSDPLFQPVWHALTTRQSALAVTHGQARRYPAAVAPFAALESASPEALEDLVPLLTPGESIYLLGERIPATSGLHHDGCVPCLQMVFPEQAPLPAPEPPLCPIEELSCAHASEMLSLIDLAYPGYFRSETCRMGRYWGARNARGTLIAMGGERFVLGPPGGPPWREISGLCRHPELADRGLGTAILLHILRQHREEGSRSWLHVTATNNRAVALYRRLGFETLRRIEAHRFQRVLS